MKKPLKPKGHKYKKRAGFALKAIPSLYRPPQLDSREIYRERPLRDELDVAIAKIIK